VRIHLPLALIAASAASANAASVVSPPGVPDSSTPIPFLVTTNDARSVRYQQVYGASDFANQGSPQYLITEIHFEGGEGSGPLAVTLPDVQIFFSTTARSPDSLSPVFANNLGPNNTLVYSGLIDWTSGSGPFAFHIPMQRPFLYDWNAGNLLMEVRNYQTVPPLPAGPWGTERLFAGVSILGDSTSLAVAWDVNSPTALLGSGGLWTMFTVTGVPEPASAFLFLVGLSALALRTWTRRARVQSSRGPAGTQ